MKNLIRLRLLLYSTATLISMILGLSLATLPATAGDWGTGTLTVDGESTDLEHFYMRTEPDPWMEGHSRNVFILTSFPVENFMLENLYRVEGLTYIEFKANVDGADPYIVLKHRDRNQASVSAPVPKVLWKAYGPTHFKGYAGLDRPIEFYGVDYDFSIKLDYRVPPPPEPPKAPETPPSAGDEKKS